MPQAKRRRRGSKLWLLVVLVLVALTAAGLGVWRFDLIDRWVTDQADPGEDPAAVAPPEGLDLPELAAPDPLLDAIATSTTAVDAAAVQAAIGPYLADDDIGPSVLVGVAPLTGGEAWTGGAAQVIPASTTKVVTSVAALEALGPARTFSTDVVDAGTGETGVRRVVLVGGGDPLLVREPTQPDGSRHGYPERASLRDLATRTAEALVAEGVTEVEVAYDAGLFTGPGLSPTWPESYTADDVVAPISALSVDRGRAQDDPTEVVADPAYEAAAWFTAALTQSGVAVVGTPTPGLGGNAEQIASVESAPVEQIVERLLVVSDNETTEVLAHHVGLEVAGSGSFDGGVEGVRTTLADLGLDLGADVIHDGSGLSRENRLSAATLLGLLDLAASPSHPHLRGVITGLPVAGFSGSLAERFSTGDVAGLGAVRAKTGTLTGVQGLAGVLQDATGTPLRFVVIADQIAPEDALDGRQAVDQLAAALAACVCSTGAPVGSGP